MTPLSIYDDPPQGAAEAAWYVYAVIDAASATAVASLTGGQLPGIDRVPVQIVVAGGLAAVAAPVELARFRAAQTELSARGSVDLRDDLARQLEAGVITEEEFDLAEDELLDRLAAAGARNRPR